MTSEIKVDTISEQTSANGVTIDGLTIKDGNIQGSPALVGTTPSFTIGDGGAEDTKIVFDGNALDYYIGLDDSADNLIIGSGSTVGSNSLITIDSDGDFTLDSAADITLDVGGGDISLKGSGAEYGKFNLSGNSLNIHSSISDGDIVFKGSDGGSAITALTLDMSDAGKAIFNSSITSGSFVEANGNISTASNSGKLRAGASNELELSHNGSHGEIDVDTGNLTLDVVGDIILDADGADVSFRDDGTGHLSISNSSNDAVITSLQSDKDMIFKGVDGGSLITALTLDMSDAGTATFNHDIVLADDNIAKFGDSGELVIYHHNNGSSYIQETGGGDLQLLASNFKVMNAAGTENKIAATTDGAVDLYYNNIKKFLTSSTGINLPVDGDSIKFGANSEVLLTHVHNTGLEISATSASDLLTLKSTDAGAEAGPNLVLFRDSASPANDDVIGRIRFEGDDNEGNKTVYAQLTSQIIDKGSSGGEDSTFQLEVFNNGGLRNIMHVKGATNGLPEVVFNESSQDVNFRVESNGSEAMFFIDGNGDHINVGTYTDLGGTFNVLGTGVFQTADNTNTLSLVCTDEDATSGPRLSMRRESSSPADDDILGQIYFTGKDSAGNNTDYATILTTTKTVANGSENGLVDINVMSGGSLLEFVAFQGSVGTVFNESSNDLDFRVESNGNANTLFVNGGTDRVGVGTNVPAQTMHIRSTGNPSNDTGLILEGGATDANCALYFYNSAGSERGRLLYDTDDNNLQFKVNTTEHFRIAANGDLTATDTSIGSNSDSRLKENIADYTYDISKFKQFKAKTFDWKNPTQHNNGTGNRGFIAQEVAAIDDYWTDQISIDPDTEDAKLIDADSNGNHMAKTLKLGKKDAMYISVIQQLITRIEALEG
jgi:hypothetical protein